MENIRNEVNLDEIRNKIIELIKHLGIGNYVYRSTIYNSLPKIGKHVIDEILESIEDLGLIEINGADFLIKNKT